MHTDRASDKAIPSGHAVVHASTATSLWDWKGDFLLYSDEGPTLLEWMPDVDLNLDTVCPRGTFIADGRIQISYLSRQTVGWSLHRSCKLRSLPMMKTEMSRGLLTPPNVSCPMSECSSIQLFSHDYRYRRVRIRAERVHQFARIVASGDGEHRVWAQNFIAVGTTINLGEDLAAKGATCVFEIVEVVLDLESDMICSFKLRLRCREEAKVPVTAVCGIDGYLVSSLGQKIFVLAFDLDERLVGVASLGVDVYVTTLRALKNLLIIGDAVKSVWFVELQEDPSKLAVVAKDPHKVCIMAADFFFVNQQLSIVACDEGAVRMYEYDPHSKWCAYVLRTPFIRVP